jgi:2C-methyl-D-erythritol 2,4-cyclodiphosphate synthase
MKPKTKTILFILLSFLLGILCGWFLEDRMFNRMQFPKGRDHGEFLKILNERLHLNERQVAQVDSILESRKQKMEIYKKQALAMRDTTRVEIRKILNTEQSKIFDEFNQEKVQQEAKRREHEVQKER